MRGQADKGCGDREDQRQHTGQESQRLTHQTFAVMLYPRLNRHLFINKICSLKVPIKMSRYLKGTWVPTLPNLYPGN